jgi:hypothetical protein
MEIKVHLGNKWWKIRTIYSKEMETTRRRVEDAMKEIREIVYSWEGIGRIGERGAKIGKRRGGDGKMQRGRD